MNKGKDEWVDRFCREALPRITEMFRPERVILFGSRVRGGADAQSDIDVIIVSSFFSEVPFIRRMSIVLQAVPFPKHVDYLCYTPSEFDKIQRESSVVMDALKSCEEVA